MRPSYFKWISVACAYLIVITAFYAMTPNAAADDGDPNDVGIGSSSIDHQAMRLTISDHDSSSSFSAVDGNGNISIVWKQFSDDRVSIKWKFSSDDIDSFTPDLVIASGFYAIESPQICLSEGGEVIIVAFSGMMYEDDNEGVYIIYTPDGGSTWSPPSLLTNGTRPSLVMIDSTAYLGLAHSVDGVSQFSIMALDLDDDDLMMVSALFSIALNSGWGVVSELEGNLNYIVYDGSLGAIAHGVSDNGIFGQPSLISVIGDAQLLEMDLASSDNGLTAGWIEDHGECRRIMISVFNSSNSIWTDHEVAISPEQIAGLNILRHDTSTAVAFGRCSDSTSFVDVALFDAEGEKEWNQTIFMNGSKTYEPNLFREGNGAISCLFTEESNGKSEIFLRRDVEFILPDISRLEGWLGTLDPVIFIKGEDGSFNIRSRLKEIDRNDKEGDSYNASSMAKGLSEDLDGYIRSVPLSNLEEIEAIELKIIENLDDVIDRQSTNLILDEGAGTITPYSTDPPGGPINPPTAASYDVYGPYFTNITRTSAVVSWNIDDYMSGENMVAYLEYRILDTTDEYVRVYGYPYGTLLNHFNAT
ncbi:MAG: hypothetical protein WC375_11410, partial [Methanomassiliicoccales archaeon]